MGRLGEAGVGRSGQSKGGEVRGRQGDQVRVRRGVVVEPVTSVAPLTAASLSSWRADGADAASSVSFSEDKDVQMSW